MISSMRARRLVEVMTVRTSGPFWKIRRSRASTLGSLRPTFRNSSASSTRSRSRHPLRTVRRMRVVSTSEAERPSRSSTEMLVARRKGSESSTLPMQALGQAARVGAALQVPVERHERGVCRSAAPGARAPSGGWSCPGGARPPPTASARPPSRISWRMRSRPKKFSPRTQLPAMKGLRMGSGKGLVCHSLRRPVRSAPPRGRRSSRPAGPRRAPSCRTASTSRGGDGGAALLQHAVDRVDAELLDEVGLALALREDAPRPPRARSGRSPRPGS